MPSLAPRSHIPNQQTRGCCACFHTAFLSTQPGICKLLEVIFGGICLGLTINYGTPVWLLLGTSYALFLTTSASALLGACIFLLSFIISSPTYRVVRSTVLEVVQNTVAAVLYGVASSFLITQCYFILWPMYLIIPYFQAYPAMMAAAIVGSVCSGIHGIDAYCAYKTFKSYN